MTSALDVRELLGDQAVTNAKDVDDLGVALIVRYTSRFEDALHAVETRTTDAPERLRAYADLYLDVLNNKRMCLCGMMAAEHETLPEPMQEAVVEFFSRNQMWLSRVLKEGKAKGTISFHESANKTARTIIGTLEGAMLLARLFGDVAGFRSSTTHLLTGLLAEPSNGTTPKRQVPVR